MFEFHVINDDKESRTSISNAFSTWNVQFIESSIGEIHFDV